MAARARAPTSGPVEYDTIRAVKAAVRIPVIANGDIATPEQAKRVLDYTGADAIMIGRAAQGRPWIFREIRHYLDTGAPSAAADGRGGARGHPAASRRPLRVLRRGHGCADRAQASRLVHEGPRRRRCVPPRGQRGWRRAIAQLAAVDRFFDTLAEQGDRLDYRAPVAAIVDAHPAFAEVTTRIATGRGGPGRVRKTLRINTGNEIGKTVEKSLDEYFRRLDGEPPHGIYDMVINHVERALIASVMDRAGGNQTQAADMLGMNRNTLRAKLTKYDIR